MEEYTLKLSAKEVDKALDNALNKSILHTPQELTDAQKEQARKNIGAAPTSDKRSVLTVNGISPDENGNVQVETGGGGGMGGADWNAAEGQPGHVKNRPFWTENAVLLEESEAEEYTHETLGKVWEIEKAPNLEVGKTYTVLYNGTPFNCVCQTAVPGFSDDPNAVAMGNYAAVGGEDTGEPFVMLISNLYNRVDVLDLVGSSSVKVGITGKVVHKLPNEYLPEHLPWTEGGGLVEILPATELAVFDTGTFALPSGVVLSAENTYTVNWNGAEYVCTPVEMVEDGITGIILGDFGSVSGGTSTGEPFVILCAPSAYESMGVSGMVMPIDGSTSVTLAISSGSDGEVHKLENKYLDLDWLPITTPSALIENQTVVNNDSFTTPEALNIYDGKPLLVVWDEKSYNTTVRNGNIDGISFYYVGNAGLVDASFPNTGETFLILLNGNMVSIYTDDVSHNMSIYDMVPNKMPEYFLPESALHLGKELTEAQKEQARANIGAAPSDVASNAVRFSAQTLTEAQKEQARANIGAVAIDTSVKHEPLEGDMPRVFFGVALPQTPVTTNMPLHYISKTEDMQCWCSLKARSGKSAKYPKKNQSFKLYSDENCTQKLQKNFAGWGEQNSFVLNANWTDFSHARNIVSARLWADVVRSQQKYSSLPQALKGSPNSGTIDGFPVRVYADGKYQGRYTVNMPIGAHMVGMDATNDNHCMLTCEPGKSAYFRAEAVFDESDWLDELRDVPPDAVGTRWNEAIAFVRDSTDSVFARQLSNYFDVDSLIDYHLFNLLSCNRGAYSGNQMYLTYDGTKWIPGVYDMECTWGLNDYGDGFVSANLDRDEYEDWTNGYGNLLYARLERGFSTQIQARWAQLIAGPLSMENIIRKFEAFTDICPPHVAAEDYAQTTADGAFTEMPSKDTNHIGQIRSFARERMDFMENYVAQIGNDKVIYELNTETVFDGQSDYLDTGIALMAEDKDFTIILDCTLDGTQPMADGRAVLVDAMDEQTGAGAMLLAPGDGYNYILNANTVTNNTTATPIRGTGRFRVVIYHSAGTDIVGVRVGWNGGAIDGSRNSMTGPWKNHNETLCLGAARDAAGNLSGFWHGTIHSLRITRNLPKWIELDKWMRETT